jgi:ribosome-associated heat shock protein Hsp15
MQQANPTDQVRADIWLWAARFFKTRSLAKQAIEGGKIDVNGGGCKPAKTLHVGDTLKIGRGEERLEVEVIALSAKRGPAPVAQALYRESEASIAARAVAHAERATRNGGLLRPPSRPNKQERRQLMKFKDQE